MSDSERVLWRELRNDRLGVRVRRQHPVNCYVLDFYVPCVKLAIEVDGDLHDSVRDARRDAHLRAMGIVTLRIPSLELFDDSKRTAWIEAISAKIESLRKSPEEN